jgi:hypothetical protein
MRCRPIVLAISFVCLWATAVRAEWTERDSRTEAGPGGAVHQHLVVEDSASGAPATLELVRFSPKQVRLESVDNPEGRDLAEVMSGGNFLAGVNGGYFDEGFAPLGLRISEGKTLSPMVRGRLMTGVIVASDSNFRILRLNEFSKSSRNRTAIQCGPFLLDRGRTIPGLNATKTARRTFVAFNGSEAFLGFSSPVSLARLSSILAGNAGNLKIQRALNLDGGSSSALWFKRKDGSSFSVSERKNVRDFVAIAPR